MARLFGTDGVRGVANQELTAELALNLSMSVPVIGPILPFDNKLSNMPGSIVALTLATAAVAAFDLPVEIIGTRFGGIPASVQYDYSCVRLDFVNILA